MPGGEPPGVMATIILHGKLKVELKSELHRARIPSLLNLTKSRIAEVAVRIYELRLIKQIENVGTELEVPRLCKRNLLRERDIPFVLSRTAADGTRSGRKTAERRVGETAGVDEEIPSLGSAVDNLRGYLLSA